MDIFFLGTHFLMLFMIKRYTRRLSDQKTKVVT